MSWNRQEFFEQYIFLKIPNDKGQKLDELGYIKLPYQERMGKTKKWQQNK